MTPPPWVAALEDARRQATVAALTTMRAPAEAAPRPAAVLMLFAGSAREFAAAHVLIVQRRSGLRQHAGHAAFPGGGVEAGDENRRATAVRETVEETGVDATQLHLLGELPELYLAASDYLVTPVVAWAPQVLPLTPGSPEEIESAHWVPLAQLLDPGNRHSVRLTPHLTGPAFDLPHLYVWGFTAGVLARFVDLAGLAPPWDTQDVRALPDRAGRRGSGGARD